MPKRQVKNSNKPEQVGHIKLGIENEALLLDYVALLSRPWGMAWKNFLAGIFRGMGFAIGSSILFTLSGIILSKLLKNFPWFTKFTQALDLWLQSVIDSSA